jgi:FKBP-type peptidyl-prolyl cis-trans isomerase 2
MRNFARALLALAFVLPAACRRDGRVQAGDRAAFFYELTVDGAVRESNFDGAPAEAVQGSGELPSGLDAALIGMSPGEEKRLVLAPAQAFGERDAAKMQTMPLSKFGELAKGLKPGGKVEGFRGGKAEKATVVSVDEGKVVLDFNHALAGKTVSYRLKVVSARAGR